MTMQRGTGTGRTIARLGVAAALLGALALAPVAASAATGLAYVNMGDSYSAGAGIAPPVATAPPDCLQSQLNWGHDLATQHGYQLTDVSCSGAQTKDYAGSQYANVPPQLNALSPGTRLVTMTIGGNDSNVFVNVITSCGSAAARTAGQGHPCQDQYGNSFSNTIRTSTYPNLVSTLRAVRAKAPNARVAISGYLQIEPPTTGCYPIMPVASGDVPYLNGIEATLNDAVKRAARATGVTFVDESQSVGHDACKPIGTRWVEPIVGSTNTVPVHPNALGEQAMAARASSVLSLGSS